MGECDNQSKWSCDSLGNTGKTLGKLNVFLSPKNFQWKRQFLPFPPTPVHVAQKWKALQVFSKWMPSSTVTWLAVYSVVLPSKPRDICPIEMRQSQLYSVSDRFAFQVLWDEALWSLKIKIQKKIKSGRKIFSVLLEVQQKKWLYTSTPFLGKWTALKCINDVLVVHTIAP